MRHGVPAAVRETIVEAIGPFVIIEVGEFAPARYRVENRDVTPAVHVTGLVTFTEARLAVCTELEEYARKLAAIS